MTVLNNITSVPEYLQNIQSITNSTGFALFSITLATIIIISLVQRNFLFEDAAITAGFTTAIINLLLFLAEAVSIQFVLTPLGLVLIGVLIKANS